MIKIVEKPEEVFSTYVEVILTVMSPLVSLKCILHVCGGDPNG